MEFIEKAKAELKKLLWLFDYVTDENDAQEKYDYCSHILWGYEHIGLITIAEAHEYLKTFAHAWGKAVNRCEN